MIKELFPRFGKTRNKLIDEMIETIGYYQSIENILLIIVKDIKIIEIFFHRENSILLRKKNK